VAETLQKIGKPLLAFISTVLPVIITSSQKAYAFYHKLPHNVVQIAIGLVFCFFGGLYPALFAAIQAAKLGGISTVRDALKDLANEAMIVLEESKKDDDVDADGDGVADVNQIDSKALLLRKANLVMTKINPKKVDTALAAISKVWLSVISVLTVQFARTIALSVSISESMKKVVNRYITPTIQSATPKEYERWVPVVVGWICKSIGISLAWYIQAVISAVTTALEGGKIAAYAILKFFKDKDMNPGGFIPDDLDETYLDEGIAYVLAVGGVYFQFKLGFDMPFPFNILLFPFEFAETYIRWSITSMASGDNWA